ncbi:ATPase of 26S proteasome regulatory subunit 4 [Cladophialophora chaetospira]|uniref:26S proteasome regulatory subunit 4 homolog n=1 Tax=Cladophialophora chaetospira TaxID=386627 RepID=A0AA38WZL9_9EURO|nr:ATPase of 26S proteasome regulatory subunit 4 [Cladophialophora chaetospira]
MGNQQSSQQGPGGRGGGGKEDADKKKEKPKYEPPPQPTARIGRKKRKQAGPNAAAKLPTIYPTARCKLRYLRMQRVHDHLLLEEEYVENQERIRKTKAAQTQTPAAATEGEPLDRNSDERSKVDDMRGSPMGVGNLEELIDDDHAIVSSATGPEYYVSIMSFVDKDLLEPGSSILLHHKSVSVVGVLTDDADPLVSVMKLDKAPTESYADIGGLEQQIQEVREAVELPLLHPELYEEMGIKPPKGVILYGAPGTGKTLLAKAVANQTSATFLRIVGSELIQKYLGDGPRLVRQLFQVAAENAPAIVFIDEIDAIGTKRYESTSGGEREIQRTMLELLNQLDGFDDRGDVKVILATNKIETLDPALIRPGRIDRKILFENPDTSTKKKIFTLHTSKMSLAEDVDLDEFIAQKDELSGADIKAICSEAGLRALRERRMRVNMTDFRSARDSVMKTKNEGEPEGLYL